MLLLRCWSCLHNCTTHSVRQIDVVQLLPISVYDGEQLNVRRPSVPILPGQSRTLTACPMKNHEVSRDAELSRILNPIPILSRFECNVTSLTKFMPNSCTEFVVVRSNLSSSKCTKSISTGAPLPNPAEGAYDAPSHPQ